MLSINGKSHMIHYILLLHFSITSKKLQFGKIVKQCLIDPILQIELNSTRIAKNNPGVYSAQEY